MIERYWIDKGQVPLNHVPGWWVPAKVADERIADLEAQERIVEKSEDGSWLVESSAGQRRRVWPESDRTRALESRIIKLAEALRVSIQTLGRLRKWRFHHTYSAEDLKSCPAWWTYKAPLTVPNEEIDDALANMKEALGDD